MKITLEFDSIEEARMAIESATAWSTISEIYHLARNQLKHGEREGDMAVLENIKLIADETRSILE